MATLLEIQSLWSSNDLKTKVAASVTIAANKVVDETITATAPTTTAQLTAWASGALSNPDVEAMRMLRVVIAANESATVSAIEGASDAAIRTNVEAAVNKIASTITV